MERSISYTVASDQQTHAPTRPSASQCGHALEIHVSQKTPLLEQSMAPYPSGAFCLGRHVAIPGKEGDRFDASRRVCSWAPTCLGSHKNYSKNTLLFLARRTTLLNSSSGEDKSFAGTPAGASLKLALPTGGGQHRSNHCGGGRRACAMEPESRQRKSPGRKLGVSAASIPRMDAHLESTRSELSGKNKR